MSGFSSLLSQFKQTTQQAASTIDAATKLGEGSAADTKKRSRSIFEANSKITHQHVTSQSKLPKQQHKHQQYIYPTTPVRTIYIACPAYSETGGPEALHQLCHMINTGEYNYADDDDDNNGDQTAAINETNSGQPDASSTQYDEFGRAIATKCNKDDKGTTGANNGSEHAEAQKKTKKNVVKAYMLYLRERSNGLEHIQTTRARSSKYDRYDAPLATTLPLSSSTQDYVIDRGGSNSVNEYTSDLVIWPECWTHLIDSLQQPMTEDGQSHNQTNKYQIAIWWLSVNNNKGRFLPHQFGLRCDILHLVQSTYAKEYVSSKLLLGRKSSRGSSTMSGKSEEKEEDDRVLNVMNMTEFISYASPAFSPKPKISTDKEKEDVDRDLDVVYNTAKGMHYTDEIIKRACGKKAKTNLDGSVVGGGLKFNPIGKGVGGRERMTEEEVVALLKRSKVYIDFGPHPGMDRLPREAALAGCVVVTNREGAANFDEDVPIRSEFKFRTFDVDAIYKMLKECCNKHEEYADKMKPYRDWILGQEKKMELCVDRFINRVTTRRIATEMKIAYEEK